MKAAPKKNLISDLISNITVDKNMRDCSNDPTVKRRTAEAIEFLKKYPIPESSSKKKAK